MIELNKVYNENCLVVLGRMPDGCVNLMLQDPPYNQTAMEWEYDLDFDKLWREWLRVGNENCVYVFTASQPFTTELICSNRKHFKCEWIWKKNRGSNFAGLKTMPFKEHENIIVFCKGRLTFNPQMEKRTRSGLDRVKYDFSGKVTSKINGGGGTFYNQDERREQPDERHPSSVQEFNTEVGLHPTQKPIDLFRYLIKTYSNEGDLVFDGYGGSGTTAVAAYIEKRNYILSEISSEYCEIANKRLLPYLQQTQLF